MAANWFVQWKIFLMKNLSSIVDMDTDNIECPISILYDRKA